MDVGCFFYDRMEGRNCQLRSAYRQGRAAPMVSVPSRPEESGEFTALSEPKCSHVVRILLLL
jgi:hypothetical protein